MALEWTSAVGGMLLALLLADAFLTVLHSASGAGPYTALQNRSIWRLARALERVGGGGLLTWAAPVMALATPAAWVALLTLGFAGLYLPALDSFSTQPPPDVGRWVTALYYSGYLTSTLGLGDIVPSGGPWRIAAVVHSAVGFALFSAAITYILSIYGRHTDDSALALFIHDALRGGEVATWGAPDSPRRLLTRRLATDLAAKLAAVNVAHRQYPILHYFHGGVGKDLVVEVGRVVDLVEAAPEDELEAEAGVLRRTIEDFLRQMPFDIGGEDGDESLGARHRRLLEAHGHVA